MSGAPPGGWIRTITARQWRTLAAALTGWMLDGMDVMLYAFAIPALEREFGIGPATAGAIASLTLVTSAAGGIAAGLLADRYGRARVLAGTILVYSICTGATATAGGIATLGLWRALVGLGLGGEWSAGSVLVAETWPAAHRGKAIGLMQSGWAVGYLLAASLAALVLPRWGWRPLFLAGTAPALLAFWVRRRVPEPEIWVTQRTRRAAVGTGRLRALLRPPLRSRVAVASCLTAVLLFAYWGLFTWIPTYLSGPLEKGGAGLGLSRSWGFIAPMQIGAFCGYVSFGVVADRIGRRPAFLLFVLGAATLVPLYGLGGRSGTLLFALGPLVGFFGHGYFSLFGAMLAELFPSSLRATAQGLCYNAGRAVGALAPFAIGAASDRLGYGPALALTSAFYLAGAVLIGRLPETRGAELS
jgi:MFS family permease